MLKGIETMKITKYIYDPFFIHLNYVLLQSPAQNDSHMDVSLIYSTFSPSYDRQLKC